MSSRSKEFGQDFKQIEEKENGKEKSSAQWNVLQGFASADNVIWPIFDIFIT